MFNKRKKLNNLLSEYNLDIILSTYGMDQSHLGRQPYDGVSYVISTIFFIVVNVLTCYQTIVSGWKRVLLGVMIYFVTCFFITGSLEEKKKQKKVFLITLLCIVTLVQFVMTALLLSEYCATTLMNISIEDTITPAAAWINAKLSDYSSENLSVVIYVLALILSLTMVINNPIVNLGSLSNSFNKNQDKQIKKKNLFHYCSSVLMVLCIVPTAAPTYLLEFFEKNQLTQAIDNASLLFTLHFIAALFLFFLSIADDRFGYEYESGKRNIERYDLITFNDLDKAIVLESILYNKKEFVLLNDVFPDESDVKDVYKIMQVAIDAIDGELVFIEVTNAAELDLLISEFKKQMPRISKKRIKTLLNQSKNL